jgi:tRNA (guanine-N(7)-)-methyltransferase subunit TRM82
MRRFVSAMHIPKFDPSTLISGGGDSAIKLWDWMSGRVQNEIEVWSRVEPFVKVRSKKYRWGVAEGEGDEDTKRKGKRKRSKGKGKGKVTREKEDEEMDDKSGLPETAMERTKEADSTGDILLVIHKIETLDSGLEYGRHIVFSAVGFVLIISFVPLTIVKMEQRNGSIPLSVPSQQFQAFGVTYSAF